MILDILLRYIFKLLPMTCLISRVLVRKSWQTLDFILVLFFSLTAQLAIFTGQTVESVQDFLIKLDMKPCMHLVEISIFSLNLVIVRLTKIMNRADKNWAQFQKIKYLENQNFQKHFLIKVGLLKYFSSIAAVKIGKKRVCTIICLTTVYVLWKLGHNKKL